MKRCFSLAKMGQGKVKSNPLVGSVIVHDDSIIGEGYHEMFGSHHAEVNSINSVKDKSLLKQSTIYVNLEPCFHFGKTPPCADLILKEQIPHVVIANRDPHSLVDGKGLQKLKKNGVKVELGILEDEGKELNKRFFTFQEKKRPYIVLKWAQSIDGFMDIDREVDQKGIHWITGPQTGVYSHRLRASEMGIVVGATTVKVDNPSLTTRNYPGDNPIRIVLDRKSEINEGFEVLNDEAKSIIFNSKIHSKCGTNEWVKINFEIDPLNQILKFLYERSIVSVLVEGGKMTLQSFIDHDLWDEAHILEGPKEIHSGLRSPELNFIEAQKTSSGADSVYFIKNKR